MEKRHITETALDRACGCSLENIAQIQRQDGLRFDTAEKLFRSIGLRVVISLKEEPRIELEQE
jgi:hypothetical protein